MTAKECRQSAWGKLGGQWGAMALVTLVYNVIYGAASSIGIGAIVVGGPLELGMREMALNIARGKQEKFENMFNGFKKNFGGAILAQVLIGIFTFLWSLLLIIPGIVKSYSYAMTFFVMADNPNMDANSARKRSMELMRGNKWRLFCLNFSFIGWDLLCVLTCGILYYWITPYKYVAYAEFYRSLVPDPADASANNSSAQSAGYKTCPGCGMRTDKNAAFCTNCGAAMPIAANEPKAVVNPTVFCTNCGAKNDENSAFCTSCGAKIK